MEEMPARRDVTVIFEDYMLDLIEVVLRITLPYKLPDASCKNFHILTCLDSVAMQ